VVVVVKAVIEKCFTSAYKALEEKTGGLWIYIYSSNNNIKARCLIGI